MTDKTKKHSLDSIQIGDLFVPTASDAVYRSILIVDISPTNSVDIRQIRYCVTRETGKTYLVNDNWHQRDVNVVLDGWQRFSSE